MYIFKNALKSITRNKGRNILIGVIIIVIAISTTISLAILSSANKLIDSTYENNSVKATIGVSRSQVKGNMDKENMEQLKSDFNNISLSLDDIDNYGDSNYVESYYYEVSLNVSINDIEAVTSEISSRKRMYASDELSANNFSLRGYSSEEAMSDFITGNYKITDGKADISQADTCLISDELANQNDLEVGSKLSIVYNENTYELEIVGIYEDNTQDSGMQMFSNSSNQIITSADKISEIDSNASLSPTYILTSIDDADAFNKEVIEKGLNEYLEVQNNVDEVKNSVSSISDVKTFAQTFLIICLIIGAIVLFVINMINIRERKYEIGVLRTIGMSKFKLSIQFIIETLMVTLVSLIIGAIIGSVMSVNVSNYLLDKEITNNREMQENIGDNFGMKDEMRNQSNGSGKSVKNFSKGFNTQSLDEVTEINAVVDVQVLVQLLLIGIALSLLSSSVSMVSIQRFRPLKILQERS